MSSLSTTETERRVTAPETTDNRLSSRLANSLAVRYLFVVGTFLLLIQLLFGAFQIYNTYRERQATLNNQATDQAEFLAAVIPEAVYFKDFLTLETLVREVSSQPDYLYSIILDNDGAALTRYLDPLDELVGNALTTVAGNDPRLVAEELRKRGVVREVRVPIITEGVQLGDVWLGYTFASLRAQMIESAIKTLGTSLAISLLLMLLTQLLFNWQVRNPLLELGDLVNKLATGDLSQRAVVRGSDEIDQLKLGFNSMAGQLQDSLHELQSSNDALRTANQALAYEQSLLVNLMDNVPDQIYFKDTASRFVRINRAMATTLNLAGADALIGQTDFDVVNEELATQFFAEEQEMFRTGTPIINRLEYNPGPSNEPRWLSATKVPIRDADGTITGMVGVSRDITDRVAAEEALRQSEVEARKLSMVASRTKNLVIIADADGYIEWVNDAFIQITGYQLDEVVGRRPGDFLQGPETDSTTVEMMSTMLRQKSGFEAELINYTRENEPYWLSIEVQPVYDDQGELINFIALETVITERKEAEAQLRNYASELERSNRELQDFAYVASHDLQEPLRKIQAFGSRLQSKYGATLDDRGQEYLARMLNAAARSQDLINDLLSFSRVSNSTRPFQSVDLNRTVAEVVEELLATEENMNIHIDIEPLPTIEADPTLMYQLLQNLLTNAIKFSREQENPEVRVTSMLTKMTKQGNQSCVISVQDNGIGFDPKYADRIFTIFQRLHGRDTYEGTGIGLAICRRIVERHHGQIRAESTPGQGATFVVTLPLSQG